MEFAGYLAADAPDPAERGRAEIVGLGIPAAGFVPQRHLEERGETGVATSRGSGSAGPDDVTISRTYLLWRNPEDRDDPVNLAALDEATAASLAVPPRSPIPAWLEEARQLLRYPRLWEAVQTHWWAAEEHRHEPADLLIAHAEYILTNRFAAELGLTWPEWFRVPAAALQAHEVVVDGRARAGLRLDTDPFVLGLATTLEDGRVLTAVIPRDELPSVTLDFVSSAPIR